MKSQRNRFLRCIPAVRFGLLSRAKRAQDPGLPFSSQHADISGDCAAPSIREYPAKGDAPVPALPSARHIPTAVPEVGQLHKTSVPSRERDSMPAHAAKVVVLANARSARHRGHVQGEAKGLAIIIPFPQPGRRGPGRAPLKPGAHRLVPTQCGLPFFASSVPRQGRSKAFLSFPEAGKAGGPPKQGKGTVDAESGEQGIQDHVSASHLQHSRHKGNTGEPRVQRPGAKHAVKSIQPRRKRSRVKQQRPRGDHRIMGDCSGSSPGPHSTKPLPDHGLAQAAHAKSVVSRRSLVTSALHNSKREARERRIPGQTGGNRSGTRNGSSSPQFQPVPQRGLPPESVQPP